MSASKSKTVEVKAVETTEDVPVEGDKEDDVDGKQTEIAAKFSNILNTPKVCEVGYKLDHEGTCRKIIF